MRGKKRLARGPKGEEMYRVFRGSANGRTGEVPLEMQ
jgi:hypothetical protein